MILTTLAVIAALSLENPSAPKEWRESFPVAGRPTLALVTDDADVQVRTHGQRTVEVVVRHHRRTWGWAIRERAPVVRLSRSGDRIQVEARGGDTGVLMGGVVESFSVEVLLPDSSDLDIRSGDGDVTAGSVRGQVTVRASDGDVELTGVHGDIEVSTTDGRVRCEGIVGRVKAHTEDGRVTIAGRLDGLDARSGDGRVQVEAAPGSRLADPWQVQTRDGSITVAVPRDLAALLDASTRDGRIKVELPIRVPSGSERRLVGELNGGRVPLQLRSGDGNITLLLSN